MSDSRDDTPFPRGPLYAAGSLVGIVILAVVLARITGLEPSASSGKAQEATFRELKFEDRADGGVAVFDPVRGVILDVLPAGTNGFLRATLRGMARDRKRHGAGPEIPFRLALRPGGGVLLQDPVTGRMVDLRAFGKTNADVFARLLQDDRSEKLQQGQFTAPFTNPMHPQITMNQRGQTP